jgi:integrase
VVQEVPTFHVFASEWLARRTPELSENTGIDYRWALVDHLLPFFAEHLLTDITIREVDRYTASKVREGRLSHNSINKTVTRLSMILGDAVEYELITANPGSGRKRRLKRDRPDRPYVEPEQLPALLEAADGLVGEYQAVARPILATLSCAGLRIGEALDLEWRDVNLSTRTLKVRESKTEAGVREVDLSTDLADRLATLKAKRGRVGKKDPVFASFHYGRADRSRPSKLDRHRVRERILKPAARKANEILEGTEIDPIVKITLHGLRRTCATLRIAAGDDPVYVSDQLGHTDPAFTMRIYARATKRRRKLSGETLKAFDQALQLAEIGRIAAQDDLDPFGQEATDSADSALAKEMRGCARQDSNLRPHAPEACALSS